MFDSKDFDRLFEQSQNRVAIMFRIVATFNALIVVAFIGLLVFAGVVAHRSVEAVQAVGVRGVVEQLWCGNSTDCALPK
jgi:hypothetical protein